MRLLRLYDKRLAMVISTTPEVSTRKGKQRVKETEDRAGG
jgi:hypothetical protein